MFRSFTVHLNIGSQLLWLLLLFRCTFSFYLLFFLFRVLFASVYGRLCSLHRCRHLERACRRFPCRRFHLPFFRWMAQCWRFWYVSTSFCGVAYRIYASPVNIAPFSQYVLAVRRICRENVYHSPSMRTTYQSTNENDMKKK